MKRKADFFPKKIPFAAVGLQNFQKSLKYSFLILLQQWWKCSVYNQNTFPIPAPVRATRRLILYHLVAVVIVKRNHLAEAVGSTTAPCAKRFEEDIYSDIYIYKQRERKGRRR